MSKPHKSEPDLAIDLKALGFDEDGETPEPDTGMIVQTIFEDQKTPGNARSFLAIFGYQRATRKELRDLKHWLALRFAYALGFMAAATALCIGAFELWRALRTGH